MDFKILKAEYYSDACGIFFWHVEYTITAEVSGGDSRVKQVVILAKESKLQNTAYLKRKFLKAYDKSLERVIKNESRSKLENSIVGKVIDP